MSRVSLVLAILLATPSLRGQAPQNPVFRGGVTLVPVDVIVLDRDGKPVPGLTADDFELKLDGHTQPVRTVAYEQADTAPPSVPVDSVPRREIDNATPAADPRVVVLLVDDLVIPASRDKSLFFAASRFVSSLPASDLVGFATSSGTVGVNPTRDRGGIEDRLRHLVGQFVDPRQLPPSVAVGLGEAEEIKAGDESLLQAVLLRDCPALGRQPGSCQDDVRQKVQRMAALVQDTTDRQVLSYLSVIDAMRGAPGQKVLVVLSDGLVVTTRGKNQAVGLESVARAAAAAGVQFSVLFADPDASDMSAHSSADAEMRRADGQVVMQGIQTVADLTGGSFYRVMGQADRFFGFVAEAISGVYHLGVEAPSGTRPGHEFKLAAAVKRQGLSVRANRVAVVTAPAAPIPIDVQLRDAVTKGLASYGVPITLGTVLRRGNSAAEVVVSVNVEIPASAPGPLSVMFGLVDSSGKLRAGRNNVSAPANGADYRISLSVPVALGDYQLRFAIADAAGRLGSVNAKVHGQLTKVGPFFASDVFTAWSGVDGKEQFLALEKVPTAATALAAAIELYGVPGVATPSDIRVAWAMINEAGQPVAEQTIVPTSGPGRWIGQAHFALATIPVSTYELRATVLVDGQPVGTVSTTVRRGDGGDDWNSRAGSVRAIRQASWARFDWQ